jgi:hypothetical protein
MEFHALICPPADNVHTFVHAVSDSPRVQHVSSSGAGSVFTFDRVTGYNGDEDDDEEDDDKLKVNNNMNKDGNKEMENAARGALDGLLAAVVSGSSVAVIVGGEADDFGIKQKLVRQVVLTAAKELFAMREEALESFPEDGPAFSLRLSCFAVDADVAVGSNLETETNVIHSNYTGIKETVLDALAAAAGVGAALNPGSGPFSPGGRYGPSTSSQSSSSASSSSALAGSILLSPKKASDGDNIPFGSSSYVQQQHQQRESLNSGVYSAAALMATASGHGFSEHSTFGSLHVPSLWEVECEDQGDVVDVCEAIDETLSSPAFAAALARQTHNRSSRDTTSSSSAASSMSYHSCVQLTLHRKDEKQASKLSVLRLARASAQVSQSSRSSSSISTPRGKNASVVSSTSSVPAWVVALCDVLAAVEQRSPRVPFSSSRATLMLRDSLTGRTPSVFLVPVPNLDALGLATLRIATRIQAASKILAQVVGQTVNSNAVAVASSQANRLDDDNVDNDNNINTHFKSSTLLSSSSVSVNNSTSRKTAVETADLLLKEIDQQREHDSHVNRALQRSHLLSTSSTTSDATSAASMNNFSSSTSNARSVSFSDPIERRNVDPRGEDDETSSDGLLDDDDDDDNNNVEERYNDKHVVRIQDRSFPLSSRKGEPIRAATMPVAMIKSPTAVSVSIIKGATAEASIPITSSSFSQSASSSASSLTNPNRSKYSTTNTSTLVPLASPTGRTGLDLEFMGSRLAATSKELFSATVEALDRSKVQVAHLAEQVEQMRQQRDKSEAAASNNPLSMSQLSYPPPPPPPPPRATSISTTDTATKQQRVVTSTPTPAVATTTTTSSSSSSSSGIRPKQTATSLARASMAKTKTKSKGKIQSNGGGYMTQGKGANTSSFTYDADDNNVTRNGHGAAEEEEEEDDGGDLDEAMTENIINNNNNFEDFHERGGSGFGFSTINKTSSRNVAPQSQIETQNDLELQKSVLQKLQAEFIILRGERDRLLVESKAMQKITRDYSLYREVIQGAMTRLQKDTERLVQERDAAVASLKSEKTAHAKEKIAHTACKRRIAELEYIVSAFDSTQKTKEEAAHALGQLRVAIREAAAVHTNGSLLSAKKQQQMQQQHNNSYQQQNSNSNYSEEEVLNLRQEYEALVKKATAAEERANALENELSASHVSMAQLLMATATGNGNSNQSFSSSSNSSSLLDTSVVATAASSLSAATAAVTRSPSPLPPTVPSSSQKASQPRRNSFSEGQQRHKSSSSSSSLGSIHASSPSSSSSSYLHALQHRASAVGLGVKNAAGSTRSLSSAILSVDDAMTTTNSQQLRPPRPGVSMTTASAQKPPPSTKFELASGRVNGMLNRGPIVGASRVSFGNQTNQQVKASSASSASSYTPRRTSGGSGYGQTPQRIQKQQQQQQQQSYQGASLDPTSAELLETVNSLASEVSAAVGSLYTR